ncbi:MAG: hypothetical protein ACQESF_02855, partial [Nanobdellota archaeon]
MKVGLTDKLMMPVFMIFLVLMLPVHSAYVFASTGSLRNVEAHGSDDIQNIIKEYGDGLNIELEASMFDNDANSLEINPQNLIFTIDGHGSYEFDSCQPSSGDWYSCDYSGDLKDWSVTKHSINIKLYTDDFVRLDQSTQPLCVDENSPVIESFDMPDSATTDPIMISYSFSDSSNDDCPSVCAGLDKAIIKKDNSTLYTDDNISGCSASGNFNTTPGELSLVEGKNEVCIEVNDKTGKTKEQCEDIFVDYNPPEFISGSVNLTDSEGNVIDYSSSKIESANLDIKVKESISKIRKADVIANLSDLYSSRGNYDSMAADTCAQVNDTFTCSWNDFNIRGDGSDTAKLSFSVSDVAGNSVEKAVNLELPFDDTRPAVTGVKTKNENFLNSSGDTIIAEISETGSGLDKAIASADLHSLNDAYGFSKDADECSKVNNQWLCYWHNINTNKGSEGKELNVIITDLEDDAGNIAEFEHTGALVFDSQPPEIINLTMKPLGVDIDVLREGDVAEIIAVVKDNVSGIDKSGISVNYGDIYPGKNWTTADSCDLVEGSSSKYECRWEYSGQLEPDKWVELSIKAKDKASNQLIAEDASRTFVAAVEEKKVDFWEDEITSSTSKLNPNFLWMSSSGTLATANVVLSPKSSQSYVHAFMINECKGSLSEDGNYDTFDIYRSYSP